MLRNAELLQTKLCKRNSYIAALTHITDQVADIVGNGSDGSRAIRKSTVPHNGECEFKLESQSSNSISQRLSGSLHLDKSSSAIQRVLGVLGIAADHALDLDQLGRLLDVTVSEQERKNGRRSGEVHSSVLLTMESSTRCVSNTEQLLINALLIDTLYGGIKMSNAILETRMMSLRENINSVGSRVAEVDLDKLHDRNAKLEDFVNTWGVD